MTDGSHDPTSAPTKKQALSQERLRGETALLEDLSFQVEQLRGRMAALKTAHEYEVRQIRHRCSSKTTRYEAILTAMDKIARRVERLLDSVPQGK